MKAQIQNHPGDEENLILKTILAAINEASHIDTTSLSSDYNLVVDYGLSSIQVQRALYVAAVELGLEVTIGDCRVDNPTLRSLTLILNHWNWSRHRKAA